VAFKANWEAKSSNIRAIADELQLPLESMVFVDDNPAERAEVSLAIPEMAVPDLPEDPAEFVEALDAGRFFEAISLTREDIGRTATYQARREAREGLSHATDLRAYLASLEMHASLGPFDELSFERITQLVNKTNQFNLTTRRVVLAEIQEIARSADWLTWSVRLRDRFGDHGLISVVFGHIDRSELVLDVWLMSCRVLGRGVEDLLFNAVVSRARERGLREVVGLYRPTARNGLVRDHYRRLGFSSDGKEGDAERWRLDVSRATRRETFIACEEPLRAS
jgi:FkbH-like protein